MARKRCQVVWYGPLFKKVPAKTVKRRIGAGLYNAGRRGACESAKGACDATANYTAVRVGSEDHKTAEEVRKVMQERYGKSGKRGV